MAERPYITGAIAVGIVATALHLGTAPSPSPALQSSISSVAGTHGRPSLTSGKNTSNHILWSDEMKNDPGNLGRTTADKDLTETIEDFHKSPPNPSAASEKASVSQPGDDLEVMIAIEPDPIHTHLSLLFDREIDALEDALQTSGWQYESNWLPWSPSSSSNDHFVDQEQQRLFFEGREQYPGVMLFRSNRPRQSPNSRHPLAVFIVGNSPTGGIDHAQFEEALRQLHKFAPDQTTLKILGPSFTGSGPSLRSLLRGARISNPNLTDIMIASGSISDPHCEDLLPEGVNVEGLRSVGKIVDSACATPDRRTTFISFGIDNDWRNDQIVSFLLSQGRFNKDEIAILNEGESSYGSLGSVALALDQASSVPRDPKYQEPLRLFFPRNISHLRNAYQKSNIFGFGASTQSSGNISLNLNFEEGGGDDDAMPTFASQQMPVSQDGVMRQITTVLEQRRIKVVLLSATDILDELFVAEILARQAPNTLVVVNQADNLFLRSSSTNNYDNMYFVSPWPLITDSQLWSRPRGHTNLRIFADDLAQGLYAAVQYLQPPLSKTPDSVVKVPDLPDYSSPLEQTNRPPLWFSAVGRGAFWPVALLNQPPKEPRSPFHLPVIPQQGNPAGISQVELAPLSQRLILLLLCLFALYHAAKCFEFPLFHNLSGRYATYDSNARLPKLSLQLSMTVLLLLALMLCISPVALDISSLRNISLAALAVYITGFALCAAAAYLLALLVPLKQSSSHPWLARAFFLISLVLIAWAACSLWSPLWSWLSVPSGFPQFFLYRATYPLRGVSPVFPLALSIAALFVLFYNHLDRIAFTPNLGPRLPPSIKGLPNCPSENELKPVTNLLTWPPSRSTVAKKSWRIVLIFALVLVCIKPLHLRPRMFDGPHVQKALGLAMILIVIAILWELVMAATIWQRLKFQCLDRLESSSLRRGFSTVSGITWSGLWIIQGNPSARYRSVTRLLEQASRVTLEPQVYPANGGSNLHKAMQALFTDLSSATSPRKIAEDFGAVQQEIAVVAGELLEKLQPAWHCETHRITIPDTIAGEEQPAGTTPEKPIDPVQQLREEWVALVYIHYIRMVLLQIRSRLITAPALYIFLVWAATSYPYLNRHVLLIALSVLLGILSFSLIYLYGSINRDAILSRTTNHIPGHLDLDFYLKIAGFVGVPLLGFIAAQFPEVSGFVFSWIEPNLAGKY